MYSVHFESNCVLSAAMAESSGSGSPLNQHGYVPLNQVALYSSSSQMPVPHPGIAGRTSGGDGADAAIHSSRRLLLVHNRTYCVTVESVPGGSRGTISRRILVQPLTPPSYEEALAAQQGAADDTVIVNDEVSHSLRGAKSAEESLL